MPKAKLNNMEKYAIQGMLHEKKNIKDIATELSCKEEVVQQYVDTELNRLHEMTVKNEIKKSNEKRQKLKDMKQAVYDRMGAANTAPSTAERLVKKALKKHPNPPNSDMLYNWAMAELSARDLMISRTSEQKREGVSIMTEAASSRGDELLKNMPKSLSRLAKNNLYSISEDKVLK